MELLLGRDYSMWMTKLLYVLVKRQSWIFTACFFRYNVLHENVACARELQQRTLDLSADYYRMFFKH